MGFFMGAYIGEDIKVKRFSHRYSNSRTAKIEVIAGAFISSKIKNSQHVGGGKRGEIGFGKVSIGVGSGYEGNYQIIYRRMVEGPDGDIIIY